MNRGSYYHAGHSGTGFQGARFYENLYQSRPQHPNFYENQAASSEPRRTADSCYEIRQAKNGDSIIDERTGLVTRKMGPYQVTDGMYNQLSKLGVVFHEDGRAELEFNTKNGKATVESQGQLVGIIQRSGCAIMQDIHHPGKLFIKQVHSMIRTSNDQQYVPHERDYRRVDHKRDVKRYHPYSRESKETVSTAEEKSAPKDNPAVLVPASTEVTPDKQKHTGIKINWRSEVNSPDSPTVL